MLCPKKIKYRKVQKGRISGIENRSTSLLKGSFGIKSLSYGRISSQQLESARRSMSRKMRRHGKIWIRIFPYLPVTSKPAEVRMGKGKGSPDFWVSAIKAGQILFETSEIDVNIAYSLLKSASKKLPILTKIVKNKFKGLYII